jgi:hypothetical protein
MSSKEETYEVDKGHKQNGPTPTTKAVTQRLETFVRNSGWQYTDTSLTDELTSQGADPHTIDALLTLARTLRQTGAA